MKGMLAQGIAHVSFVGGAFFLPARTPYDRQILTELVAERVRTTGQVQLLMNDRLWTVRLASAPPARACSACGAALESARCATTPDDVPYCIACVVAYHSKPPLRARPSNRRAEARDIVRLTPRRPLARRSAA